jgi:hypothetical protein
MADLNAQSLPLGGLQPTYASAAAGGDTTPIGDKLVLHVFNGSASSVTVTAVTPGNVGGLAIGDAALAVAAGENGFLPLNRVYRSPVSGRASITYSAATSVEVAVLRLP